MVYFLDFKSDTPIYQQIRNEIVKAISLEEFVPGDRLPTIRGFAADIGVNAMTVSKAYDLLKQDGYIITDRRRGAMVTQVSGNKERVSDRQRHDLHLLIRELRVNGVSKEKVLQLCNQMYEEE